MGPERRLRFFISARIFVSFLFLLSAILLKTQESASVYDHFQSGMVRLMLISFLFSVISFSAINLTRYLTFVTYLQIIWDLLFTALLMLFTGGVLSPYSFLYLLSIMIAGVLLGRREALYTAALCGIIFGALIDFQYFGYLSFIGISADDARALGASHLFYTIFMNLIGFGLTALLTGYLSERARDSEVALREKIINLEELSQLNSAIVTNIETGLLTVNNNGRIRVCNPYAEVLTGLEMAEIYDADAATLFPQIQDVFGDPSDSSTGEFEYVTPDGLLMILGYNAVPFNDVKGKRAGLIVNFRDLTALRRMEDALKRSDRMAAVGELSARMAHEIRNPLAALCGSVQLLSTHGAIDSNDQRLLNIVTRESARLEQLVTEFLAYARPSAPTIELLELHGFIEDIKIFMATESRFQSVVIENLVPTQIELSADSNQLRQVIINLLQNAADAMSGSGTITISANFILSGSDGYNKSPGVRIEIMDTGPGLSEEVLHHLFEPFWTTKLNGTGLGLAICYRIIEQHSGTINVETTQTGGCRFVVTLPLVR